MSPDRRKILTLIAMILGSNVVFLDGSVVNVALPSIQRDLDTGLAGQQWIVEAYLLTLVAVLLVGGSLGDLYGRKRIFLIGLVGFGLTSSLCALAPTSEALIAGRALQGLAGALLVPGSLAIIAATFGGERRGWAVGTWTAWAGISTVAGPAAGGALIEALSWRWVFWINIPLILFTLWLTLRAVDESSDPEACKGIDYTGIGLSAFGLGGPVFGLIQQPTEGWGSPLVLIPMVAGVIALLSFVVWEGRARAPMLPLSLFAARNFTIANVATLAVYAGLIGATFFLTIFLQQVANYSPLEAGLATMPTTVIMFVLSPRFGALSSRIGPRLPMTVGPITAGIGLLLLIRVDVAADYLPDVLPGLLIFSVGLALTVAPLTSTVLDAVEDRHSGIASGVNNAVARVAGLLAIAVLGAAISAQFLATVDAEAERLDLGPQARSTLSLSKESPFASPDVAGLSPPERAQVQAVASSAALDGLHIGVIVSGGLCIIGGIVAGIGIVNSDRRRPGPGQLAENVGNTT